MKRTQKADSSIRPSRMQHGPDIEGPVVQRSSRIKERMRTDGLEEIGLVALGLESGPFSDTITRFCTFSFVVVTVYKMRSTKFWPPQLNVSHLSLFSARMQ